MHWICPTDLRSGLFVARGRDGRLVESERLGEVLGSVDHPTLDDRAIAGWLGRPLDDDATAFVQVRRVPPGRSATWEPIDGRPVLAPLESRSVRPRLHDAVDGYLDTFDRAVDAQVARNGDGPLCLAMSGGLDSTFVAASLLRHATPDRPVRAFIHVPHPDAALSAIGNWDPDDLEAARSVERSSGGRLVLTPVANIERVQPLDAAARAAEATWSPAFNPANTIWIDEMRTRAHDLGAVLLFNGEHGNAVFSADHPYALRHHLRYGAFGAAADVWQTYRSEGTGRAQIVRRHLVGPAVRWTQASTADLHRRRRPAPIDPLAPPRRGRPMSRQTYLAWLRRDANPLGTLQPEPGRASLIDPFSDAAMIDLAASMTPAEWTRYGTGRGYARRLGLGRVPDEVRFRTRRGGQSWDHWFIVRTERDRYLDEVRSLAVTPIVSDLIDAPTLARIDVEVASWPWGELGHAPLTLLPIERLLALAMFVRSTQARLAALTKASGPATTPPTSRPSSSGW